MHLEPIVRGVSTYFTWHFQKNDETVDEARKLALYGYGVWFRDLSIYQRIHASNEIPSIIAEFGPGNALGVGISGLLSGVTKYHALDINRYWNSHINEEVFKEAVKLFESDSPIPTNKEFQQFRSFSLDAINQTVMPPKRSSEEWERRKESIDDAIRDEESNRPDSALVSVVPWKNRLNEFSNRMDLLTSQDCMEHVEDIESAYRAMWTLLKSDGMMIHQIDFSSHVGGEWNSHWNYSDLMWDWFVWGKRRYPMNRLPVSAHIAAIEKAGFKIVYITKEHDEISDRRSFYHKYSGWSDDDLSTRSAIIAAIKQ